MLVKRGFLVDSSRHVEENSFDRSANDRTSGQVVAIRAKTADYLSFCSSGSFRTNEHVSRGGRLIKKQRESVYSRLRSVPT